MYGTKAPHRAGGRARPWDPSDAGAGDARDHPPQPEPGLDRHRGGQAAHTAGHGAQPGTRDWTYVAVTRVVLAVLLFCLFYGQPGDGRNQAPEFGRLLAVG